LNNKSKLMPSALDREIDSPELDAFGHRHFALALRSIVESESHKPPYSVGLLGGWGTGKSTIKSLYLQDLREDEIRGSSGLKRSTEIRSITFNAWRFGGEDIKRALLRHVYLELDGSPQDLEDRLFHEIRESTEKRRTFLDYVRASWESVAYQLTLVSIVLAVIAGISKAMFWALQITGSTEKTALAAIVTLVAGYLFKQVKPLGVQPARPMTRVDRPVGSSEQFEDMLLAQLAVYKKKGGKNCSRLVVFVDDLDRLSSEEMVQGLDAIRTFMEIPSGKVPAGFGLVFVISCDEDRIADALSRGRRGADMPGSVSTVSDARRYLDRIFQFRLEIPPFPRRDMREYATKAISSLTTLEESLGGPEVVNAVVSRMIHPGIQSPRGALQVVNAFAQSWWLAALREDGGASAKRPGGLHGGAVTDHPVALGALCSLRVCFPDFYSDLEQEPTLLHHLTQVSLRGAAPESVPRRVFELLDREYVEVGDDSTTRMRSKHRSLRQYLSSLIGVRWPQSLLPLIQLTEDPITRKYGRNSSAIYESFASGDTQGVLEGFGREVDNRDLAEEEARMLFGMTEDLASDSEDRQVNGSRVIAELIERIPSSSRALLLGPLCRKLNDSQDLRSQVGTDSVARVVCQAPSAERGPVVAKLIGDALPLKGAMLTRLPSMEAPSLEEAIGIARTVVSLALDTRRDIGLDPPADKHLLSWLSSRVVRATEGEFEIPFGELEDWLGEHESHLLDGLGEDYLELLAVQFGAAEAGAFDQEAACSRAEIILEGLWSTGEESRDAYWRHIAEFAAPHDDYGFGLAMKHLVLRREHAGTAALSKVVSAASERLMETPLDGASVSLGGQALAEVIEDKASELSPDAVDGVARLTVRLGEDASQVAIACRLFSGAADASISNVGPVLEEWMPRILTDLPEEASKAIASRYGKLNADTQTVICTELDKAAQHGIDKEQGQRYGVFAGAISAEDWASDNLQTHLTQVLNKVASSHANPSRYLHWIFPSVVQVAQHADAGVYGSMLHSLFANAKGQTDYYAWLHSWMARRWPKSSPELSPYSPETIFADAHAFASAHPGSAGENLLNSMKGMVSRGVVEPSSIDKLISAACAVWKVDPGEAIGVLEDEPDALTTTQFVGLLANLDTSEDVAVGQWTRVTARVGEDIPSDRACALTQALAESPQSAGSEDPDLGLSIWLGALGDRSAQTLTSTITAEGIAEATRRRLWEQALKMLDAFDADQLVEVVAVILTSQSSEETIRSVLESGDAIKSALASQDAHSKLSTSLTSSYSELPTKSAKNCALQIAKSLVGAAALEGLDPGRMDGDDLAAVESTFGKSKWLRGARKQLEKGP
jgi:KAP-like P-loop domain-containing protein